MLLILFARGAVRSAAAAAAAAIPLTVLLVLVVFVAGVDMEPR